MRRIAFVSDRGVEHDIYVMDADGTNVTNVTNNGPLHFVQRVHRASSTREPL